MQSGLQTRDRRKQVKYLEDRLMDCLRHHPAKKDQKVELCFRMLVVGRRSQMDHLK